MEAQRKILRKGESKTKRYIFRHIGRKGGEGRGGREEGGRGGGREEVGRGGGREYGGSRGISSSAMRTLIQQVPINKK